MIHGTLVHIYVSSTYRGEPAMPKSTSVAIPDEEQPQMRAKLVAKDDDLHRVQHMVRLRLVSEQLGP
jgi:hypothetical protein